MSGDAIMFLVLATAVVVFAIASICERRILRAAIYLLFVLVAVSGLFYMLTYQYLAAVQLMLYAGGIVVLIIFSILLTSQISSKLEKPKRSHLLPAIITAAGGIALSVITILKFEFKPTAEESITPTIHTIGRQLLGTSANGYALPFEVISILLLAALVGTIYIARKSRI